MDLAERCIPFPVRLDLIAWIFDHPVSCCYGPLNCFGVVHPHSPEHSQQSAMSTGAGVCSKDECRLYGSTVSGSNEKESCSLLWITSFEPRGSPIPNWLLELGTPASHLTALDTSIFCVEGSLVKITDASPPLLLLFSPPVTFPICPMTSPSTGVLTTCTSEEIWPWTATPLLEICWQLETDPSLQWSSWLKHSSIECPLYQKIPWTASEYKY